MHDKPSQLALNWHSTDAVTGSDVAPPADPNAAANSPTANLAETPSAPATTWVTPNLHGHDDTPHLVAVEIAGAEAILLQRTEQGIRQERRPFRPWLMADARLDDLPGEWTRLQGDEICWLGEFDRYGEALRARDALRDAGREVLWYGSAVKQFLVRSGVTLFGQMQFQDIHRLQLDLETTGLDSAAPDAQILMIAAGDSRGQEWLFAGQDEAGMIRDLVTLFREQDPDVVEGHNLIGFDLPYLAARARALGVPLRLGRDDSPLGFASARRSPVGSRSRSYRPAYIWGRHCLDTLFAVQRFDVGRNELESYGLKAAAAYYGIAEPNRIILDRSEMTRLAREEPDRVREYALQDVRETRALAELTLPTDFYQSQMAPDTYQQVAVGGTGERINSLMVREYLRHGCGIPVGAPPKPAPGGYTEVRRSGILHRVVKCDVESLYPSIMLHSDIRPASDRLGVFLPLLKTLTRQRLDAKSRMQAAEGAKRHYWDGIQSSFKILINSFYGYLGAPFNFSDPDAAARVTTTGQALVKQVAQRLQDSGSLVIEVDTDGVYFVPPPEVEGEPAEMAYVEQIGKVLPEGIRLAHDGRYQTMVSLKIKNYALLTYDGRKVVRGAALRSRADEPFGREFLGRALDALLAGNVEALGELYCAARDKLLNGEIPISQLARPERFSERSLAISANRLTPQALRVARERLGMRLSVYDREDGAIALASNYNEDEDRWRYVEKLHRFAARLQAAIPEDFDRLCPLPDRKRVQAELAGQAQLDL